MQRQNEPVRTHRPAHLVIFVFRLITEISVPFQSIQRY